MRQIQEFKTEVEAEIFVKSVVYWCGFRCRKSRTDFLFVLSTKIEGLYFSAEFQIETEPDSSDTWRVVAEKLQVKLFNEPPV